MRVVPVCTGLICRAEIVFILVSRDNGALCYGDRSIGPVCTLLKEAVPVLCDGVEMVIISSDS